MREAFVSHQMKSASVRMTSHGAAAGASGLFFKSAFALLYILLIVASIALIRHDQSSLDNVNIIRTVLIGSSGLLWITRSTIDRSIYFSVLAVGLLLSPYLLTEAIVSYVDIVSLLIFSAALSRANDTEEYIVHLAYGSLALVCAIVFLASFGLIPTSAFEWEGRVKESYGFTNPNTLFFYIFSSAFTFFIYRRWRGMLITGLIMAALYPSVGSRTFAIAYIFIFMGFFLYNSLNGRFARFGLWLAIFAVVVSGLLTVYFPFEFSRWTSLALGLDADELFSSRFTILEVAYLDTGNVAFWLGGTENAADSLYAYLASGFGLLISVSTLVFALYRTATLSLVYGSIPIIITLAFLMVGIVEVPLDGSALMSLVFLFVIFYDPTVLQRWKPDKRSVLRRPLILRR